VLRLVAKAIKGMIRTTDTVARIGGDEFLILLIETSKGSPMKFIPRLRKYLLQVMKEAGWQVTFSIGVATYISPPESIHEVIKRADDLMYAVKQGGKDAIKYEVFDALGQYVRH
ncbi:MAG: GGDEF domain-containing protein, partial [Candidatus Omnitrophica bacterium]|nr:GGDEF domain-containing protein [Candidatus Omnitrophota bacterium]